MRERPSPALLLYAMDAMAMESGCEPVDRAEI